MSVEADHAPVTSLRHRSGLRVNYCGACGPPQSQAGGVPRQIPQLPAGGVVESLLSPWSHCPSSGSRGSPYVSRQSSVLAQIASTTPTTNPAATPIGPDPVKPPTPAPNKPP